MELTDKTTRCALSDLLVTECACRIHGNSINKYDNEDIEGWFQARFNSPCANCDNQMHEGDMIARTYDGDYVCRGCVTE